MIRLHPDEAYLDLMRHVLEHGHRIERSYRHRDAFHLRLAKMRFDLAPDPAAHDEESTSQVGRVRAAMFLKGETTCAGSRARGLDLGRWADEADELGPVYGSQWRSWPARTAERSTMIAQVVESIRTSADSRRTSSRRGTRRRSRR